MKDNFKLSALVVLESSGDFTKVGEQNGVPVYELKPEPKCEVCNKTSEYCICEDPYC